MSRIKYELDPHNRLIIENTGKKTNISRFRRIIDGKFKIGPKNSLIYHVKAPGQGAAEDLHAPHQIKLQGKWSLTKEHNLRLTLNKWRRQRPGDELTLQGEIIDTKTNSLIFAITTRNKENVKSTYILKLEGRWQADKNNRLIFRVKKGIDRYDTLTFDGIWKINKNHRIVYHYERRMLKKGKKQKKTITFKGHWNIVDKYRLSYMLDATGKSAFVFKTNAGILDKHFIKYKLGIGVSCKKRPVRCIVTLSGKWKIKRGAGLFFEIEYEKGKAQAIAFGADAKITEADSISFKLKNKFGRDLDAELTLSRRLLNDDGDVFFRFLKSGKEAGIFTGAAWRW